MNIILAALAGQVAELDGLVAGLDEAGWERPSRCPGWSIADVVLHMAQTDELVVASGEGRFGEVAGGLGGGATTTTVDDYAGQAVAAERGQPPGELLRRWRAAGAAQAAVLAAGGPRARMAWVTGEIPARTLATTRLAETWIHTGDIAAALGEEPVASERLWHIARLAWRTLPYAFARAGRSLSGPVAVTLSGPGETAWTFEPDEPAATTVEGPALDFCLVAARRADPATTALVATGPDADAVLELVRTFA